MALVNKAFSVSVVPGMMPPIVHVSEYDIGRAYTVSIIDEQGNPFTILSGTTASIEGTLNGKVGFTQSASISNNQVSFTLTESMTAYSGKAWCKIKLTLNNQPIQTCAFILAVDRAGVEAGTVIGAPGFQEQIVDAVQDWLEEHPPAAGGMTEAFKQALLDCFANVAWINDDGQTYYDALYDALSPPVDVLSISAVFTQGDNVIYDTDSLDDLKQYLVVTATTTDSTAQTVTDYTLSGTLTAGTSTITVTYSEKTTTFNVTVTPNTAAKIAVEDKILIHYNKPSRIENVSMTNGCITVLYDMESPTTVLFPAGIIPTTGTVIQNSGASIAVYDANGNFISYVNEYNRWAQNASGTMTEFSNSWTLQVQYYKIAFSLDKRYLDQAYMYDKTTGQIWFAGVNTPYFGMTNISEAQS